MNRIKEMSSLNDPLLAEVVAKIYVIGKRDYKGKIYDNVLSIFDTLGLEDQKALIRGILGLYVASTTTLLYDKDVIDSGDIDGVLAYLREIRSKAVKDTSTDILGLTPASPLPVESSAPVAPVVTEKEKKPVKAIAVESDEPYEKQLVELLKTIAKRGTMGLILIVLVHMSTIALSSDPDALSGAQIYKDIYDALVIFVK